MTVMDANGVKFMLWTDVYWEDTVRWVSTVIRVKVSMGDCVRVCALWSAGTVVGVVRWAELCLDQRYTERRNNLNILPNAYICSTSGHFSLAVHNQHWWGFVFGTTALKVVWKYLQACIPSTLLSITAPKREQDKVIYLYCKYWTSLE